MVWNKLQKRTFHRVMSCLSKWQASHMSILWITLTSAPTASRDALNYNFQRLRSRIGTHLKYRNLEYIKIRTDEGNGVIHVLLACDTGQFKGHRLFFIPQGWLSEQWKELHGSPIVWVRKFNKSCHSGKKMALYLVSQYCSRQDAHVRTSYSWTRTFGYPLVAIWRWLKKDMEGTHGKLIWMWQRFLQGQETMTKRYIFYEKDIRNLYEKYGRAMLEFLPVI